VLIANDSQRPAPFGQTEHRLGEVAKRLALPFDGVQPARANYDVPPPRCGISLRFDLAAGVDPLRAWRVVFSPRRCSRSIAKDVIGADLNQRAIDFGAQSGHPLDGEGVDRETGFRLSFGPIDVRIRRGVNEGGGTQSAKPIQELVAGDIDIRQIERNPSVAQPAAQFRSQLSGGAGDGDFIHGRHRVGIE
jgi:hypothetical protein